MKPTCEGCKFFEDTRPPDPKAGCCMRYPPSLHVNGQWYNTATSRGSWCGEFKEKPASRSAGKVAKR